METTTTEATTPISETKPTEHKENVLVQTTENVVKTTGKFSLSFIKEIIGFFFKLTFKSKVMFIIISIILFGLAYFMGYQSGKDAIDQELQDKYDEAVETINNIRDTVNPNLFN